MNKDTTQSISNLINLFPNDQDLGREIRRRVRESNNTLLWLDDFRNPYLSKFQKFLPKNSSYYDNIVWVINYDQFTEWITENGLPKAISFDHDLAEQHYVPSDLHLDYEASKKWQEDNYQYYTERTGYDCAKWLVEYCMDRSQHLPIYSIHSQNPVGADNIKGLLNNFERFIH